ncbi:MAG TPA: DUF3326 domain-containing protein [Sedimentisphaerales bacterium]|nr:DUF3326 domain-containing protein [Sedimentisphaerales bacterium]
MNVVMIVPTGIGCEIGGHCGDGNAAARLLGACCETLVLHPNVVNASDINEMPPNALYVEGNHLDRFLQGKLFLQKVKSNKVLVVVNKADYQSINAVSAARATLGLDAEILELKVPLQLIARMGNGIATGDVVHWKELVAQVKDLEYDALGIATPITIDSETLATYWRVGGVNPVGGVEALATRLIGEALDKPCAHGPVDYALNGFKEVVDPRIAVEIITENFIHCLLKGLHKAPRLSRESGMSCRDIDCMVSPYGCFGTPHQACLDGNIPVIVVRENKSCLNHPEHPKFIYVENYIEAAGMIMAMKAGVHPSSVRRPLAYTAVRRTV